MSTHSNRLAGETSPYLLQHAGNPVDWYPWCEEALEKARIEDKPILLSIGYSACHWCHVMAHESFEDEDTAAVMNALYVNVKVDREERPDLDKIYQTAHAMLTQRTGGWPLTMFLDPVDRVPFFGGTYFPGRPMHGLPAFTDLLRQVEAWFREHRDEVRSQNVRVVDALAQAATPGTSSGAASDDPVGDARRQLERSFDDRRGGFGAAPKFPHPADIEFLLRRWALTRATERPDHQARHMAVFTLERMALGGIHDHLGGGFCRYSVDEHWMIPHFEKMLYDNAALLALYGEAAAETGSALFRRTTEDTAGFVMREMQSPEGGYYSSLDADSEGEEGKFYVWTREEVREALDGADYRLFARHYGLDRPANFEGRWHLHVFVPVERLARDEGLDEAEVLHRLDAARQKLLAVRGRRVRPGRDDKILTSWNALMIRGMAIAARHLGNDDYARSAQRALDFIRDNLWIEDRLLATSKDGRAHLNAYLDDHAFLIDALLAMLQLRWRGEDLAFTTELADVLLNRFQDRERGGFFFTSDDHEALIQRPRPLADEATPAGNGIAARALFRLGLLTGEPRYLEAAERTVAAAAGAMAGQPMAHCSLLVAREEQRSPPELIILRGETPELGQWLGALNAGYHPARLAFPVPADAPELPVALAQKRPAETTVAYRCVGTTCSPPIHSLEELLRSAPDPD